MEFEGSTISPGNSVAKFQFHAIDLGSAYGTATVDYYFRWQNPSDYGTLISADGLLLLNGTLKVTASGGWDRNPHYASLEIAASLDVRGFWVPSVESLGFGSASGASLGASSFDDWSTFYKHAQVYTRNVLEFVDVQAKGPIAVPANGVVSLLVSVLVEWSVTVGSIDAYFGPDPFGVMSPGVIVTKWV